jgi:preprotein translocase subunit SecF
MKKRFSVTKNAKIFVAISCVVILAGFIALFTEGFVPGIDFSGGTILTLNMGQTFTTAEVPALQAVVDKFMTENNIKGDRLVSSSQNNQAIVRYQAFYDDSSAEMNMRANLIEKLKKTYPKVAQVSMERVGATAGTEMQMNALVSVAVACALILIYIAFRFEYVYGISAVVSLIHDVLIMGAVMIFTRTQVNSSFIAAMLTIVGYSINDTIVLFDRVRENVKKMKGTPREEIVDVSFLETLTRTLNTSLTVFFTLMALYILGVQSIREFALPLLAGVISGTYSSILIAAPLWIWIHKAMDKRNQNRLAAKKKNLKNRKPVKSKA